MKVIDAHSHYMPPAVAEKTTFFKMYWSDAESHLKKMDELGIETSLLLYPTSDGHLKMNGWREVCRVYNQGICDLIRKYPSRFIGAGILPPDNSQNLNEELKHFDDYGFKAFSLASSYDGKYLDDEMFYPVYEFAQKKDFPIHVHPQIMNPIGEDRVKDPLLTPVLEYVFDVSVCIGKMMMNDIFLKFPRVKFIFAHYGGVVPFVKERFDNTYLMLRSRDFVKDLAKNPSDYFKNLYFDTSGSKSPASLLCALELVDASHILWGSDHPANQNIADSISVIDGAPLTPIQKSSIFSENLRNLI